MRKSVLVAGHANMDNANETSISAVQSTVVTATIDMMTKYTFFSKLPKITLVDESELQKQA